MHPETGQKKKNSLKMSKKPPPPKKRKIDFFFLGKNIKTIDNSSNLFFA